MPIVIEHLNYVYMSGGPYETHALDDVSLTIEDGEFVGLIGHTGSGKSTLVQHLNGLLLPSSGKITVDGLDIADKATDRRAIRRKVGLVFQYPENQLFEETVEKDIAFGPKNLGLDDAEIDRRVRDAMRRVALDYDRLHERSVFELSGGQMRRVAIAGVLAMRPSIIVFDESTAMLDPIGRRDVFSVARRINREEGITVIWITHFMEEAVQADRVVVMDAGRVELEGAPRTVFSNVDEVLQLGLDVPEMMKLSRRLRDAGVEVPRDVLTVEEMAVELCRLK